MAVCPNCGAENPAKSKWCGKCRYDLRKIQRRKKSLVLITILLSGYCLLDALEIVQYAFHNDSSRLLLCVSFIDLLLGIIVLFSVLSKRESLLLKNVFAVYCFIRVFIQYVIPLCFVLITGFLPIVIYIPEFIIYGLCRFVAVPILYCIQKTNRGCSL